MNERNQGVTSTFITKDMVDEVVRRVTECVTGECDTSTFPHIDSGAIVILIGKNINVSEVQGAADTCEYIGEPTTYEYVFGEPSRPLPFQMRIAKVHARQLWNGGNCVMIPVHYLGGIKRSGIVVACECDKSWVGTMISRMIIDMLIGVAFGSLVEFADKYGRSSVAGFPG